MTECLSKELLNCYAAGNCTSDEHKMISEHIGCCSKCREMIETAQLKISGFEQGTSSSIQKTTVDITGLGGRNEDDFPTEPMPEVSMASGASRGVDRSLASDIRGYKILEQLPVGGQAVVYKATQEATKRTVAVKILLHGAHASRRAQYRFEREVDLAASLRHPNIVTIFDSGIAHGQYFYAMEYIEGVPLDEYVRLQKLSTRRIMELFEKVCSAAAYAHQHGVMHRDLKPGNILVNSEGQPHILDFGLAKLTDSSQEVTQEAVMTTMPGKVIGTLAFMSPEQASGEPGAIDVRTDVYSIGVILYRALTDKFPYEISGSTLGILRTIQETEPVRPSKISVGLNSEVEAILLKTLAKEPGERYQSAAELGHDIEYWLKGLPISAKSDSSLYLLKKFILRKKVASLIIALLLVIIISSAYISLSSLNKVIGANELLEATNQIYRKESEKNLTFVKQMALEIFLEFWHDDKIDDAKFTMERIDRNTRESLAARFLLDRRPLDVKIKGFGEVLSAKSDESSFLGFIFGEYYLKNNNKAEAIKAYEQCLEKGKDISELDDWFKNRAQRKLNNLLGIILPQKKCRVDKDDA